MAIQRINQVESGLAKLLEQFKGKPHIEGILTTYLQQSQDTQTTYEEMLDERSIHTAIGVQLDMIGALVGEERFGRPDEEYRTAIFVRIAINSSNGTIPDIKQIISTLTGLTNEQIRVVEHYPAGMYIYLDTETIYSDLPDTVSKLLPVAVNLGYIGYGTDDLALVPYDTEYAEVPLITNINDNIITDELESLLVRKVTQAEFYERAFLSETGESTYGICTENL
tara:strand:- start:25537 stop:26208 length:672 start_codon:yes stop_codon:yes gene_type:complete